MMAMRKFPYGYVMERGVIMVKNSEAETVRWIFENRAAGHSNWEMARKLYEGTDPYFKDDVKKTSCKISMILYEERYIGADGYPPIVDTELFETVAGKKGKQWTEKQTPRMVAGRAADEHPAKLLKSTTYIPSRAVFEKEKALKVMFRENTDAEQIRTAILDLASEKYDCIQ